MEPLLAVGGIFFYIIVAVFLAVLLGCIEYQKGWWSSILVTAFCLVLYTVFGVNVVTLAVNNPWMIAPYVVGYFVVGSVWACVKWIFYSHKMLDIVKDIKMEYLNRHNISSNVIPEDKKEDFIYKVLANSKYHDEFYPPKFLKHKADWMMWATYWPLSLFWTMLDQPIKKLWNFIYSNIGQMMQNITDKMFENI